MVDDAEKTRGYRPLRASIRESAGFQQSVFRYPGADAGEVRGLFRQLADELLTLDGGR
jgi:hypothetical protein